MLHRYRRKGFQRWLSVCAYECMICLIVYGSSLVAFSGF